MSRGYPTRGVFEKFEGRTHETRNCLRMEHTPVRWRLGHSGALWGGESHLCLDLWAHAGLLLPMGPRLRGSCRVRTRGKPSDFKLVLRRHVRSLKKKGGGESKNMKKRGTGMHTNARPKKCWRPPGDCARQVGFLEGRGQAYQKRSGGGIDCWLSSWLFC